MDPSYEKLTPDSGLLKENIFSGWSARPLHNTTVWSKEHDKKNKSFETEAGDNANPVTRWWCCKWTASGAAAGG